MLLGWVNETRTSVLETRKLKVMSTKEVQIHICDSTLCRHSVLAQLHLIIEVDCSSFPAVIMYSLYRFDERHHHRN